MKYFGVLVCCAFVVSCKSYDFNPPEFSTQKVSRYRNLRTIYNLRSVGNIKNKDGKILKDSLLFRSGDLHHLKDFDNYNQLKIAEIIDLRTKNEAAKKPDNLPKNQVYKIYPAFEDQEDQLNQAKKLVLKGKVNAKDADDRMLKFYKEYLTENPMVIKKIVTEILDSNQPILYHCTAGKDRTGMITALIMKVLKFDDESIYQEYLMSNNLRQKIITKRLKLANTLHFLYPKMDIGVLEKLSWIQRSYLKSALDEVDAEYGSMDDYIHEVLDISEEKRNFYIEKWMD